MKMSNESSILLDYIQNDPNLSDMLRSGLENIALDLNKLKIDSKKLSKNIETTLEPNKSTKDKIQKAYSELSDKYLKVFKNISGDVKDIFTPSESIRKKINESFEQAAKNISEIKNVKLDLKGNIDFTKLFFTDLSQSKKIQQQYSTLLGGIIEKINTSIGSIKFNIGGKLDIGSLLSDEKTSMFNKLRYNRLIKTALNSLQDFVENSADKFKIKTNYSLMDILSIPSDISSSNRKKYNTLVDTIISKVNKAVKDIDDKVLKEKVLSLIENLGTNKVPTQASAWEEDDKPQEVVIVDIEEGALGKFVSGSEKNIKDKSKKPIISDESDSEGGMGTWISRILKTLVTGGLLWVIFGEQIKEAWEKYKIGEILGDLVKTAIFGKDGLAKGLKEWMSENKVKTALIGGGALVTLANLLKPGMGGNALSRVILSTPGALSIIATNPIAGPAVVGLLTAILLNEAWNHQLDKQINETKKVQKFLTETEEGAKIAKKSAIEKAKKEGKPHEIQLEEGRVAEYNYRMNELKKGEEGRKKESMSNGLNALSAEKEEELFQDKTRKLVSGMTESESIKKLSMLRSVYDKTWNGRSKLREEISKLDERILYGLYYSITTRFNDNKDIRELNDLLGPDNIDSYLKSEITQRKRKSGATKLQDEKLEKDAFDPHAPAFDKDGNMNPFASMNDGYISWSKDGENIKVQPVNKMDDFSVIASKDGGVIDNGFKKLSESIMQMTTKLIDVKNEIIKSSSLKNTNDNQNMISSAPSTNKGGPSLSPGSEHEKGTRPTNFDIIFDSRMRAYSRYLEIA